MQYFGHLFHVFPAEIFLFLCVRSVSPQAWGQLNGLSRIWEPVIYLMRITAMLYLLKKIPWRMKLSTNYRRVTKPQKPPGVRTETTCRVMACCLRWFRVFLCFLTWRKQLLHVIAESWIWWLGIKQGLRCWTLTEIIRNFPQRLRNKCITIHQAALWSLSNFGICCQWGNKAKPQNRSITGNSSKLHVVTTNSIFYT